MSQILTTRILDNFLAAHPEKGMRRKKRIKTTMATAKLFALKANAIKVIRIDFKCFFQKSEKIMSAIY